MMLTKEKQNYSISCECGHHARDLFRNAFRLGYAQTAKLKKLDEKAHVPYIKILT